MQGETLYLISIVWAADKVKQFRERVAGRIWDVAFPGTWRVGVVIRPVPCTEHPGHTWRPEVPQCHMGREIAQLTNLNDGNTSGKGSVEDQLRSSIGLGLARGPGFHCI
jgi:hypothetical protein